MDDPNANLNYSARVLAANAMSVSVQCLTQRNYLDVIARDRRHRNALPCRENLDFGDIQWLKISQIGCQETSYVHHYFSVMQKILFSCHDPYFKQLLFLIHGNGTSVVMYIGVRQLNNSLNNDDSEFTDQLSTFIKSSWRGVNVNHIEYGNEVPTSLLDDKVLKKVYSLTGIPSFVKKDGEEQLTSIDSLLGTLSNQKFAYLVIADPIDENKVSSIIHQCNEMAGQLESVKTFNFTDTTNSSTTQTESITKGINSAKSISDSKAKKDTTGSLLVAGMQLAAGMCFTPAANMLTGGIAAIVGMGLMMASGATAGFVPTSTHSESKTEGYSISKGFSEAYTTGQSKSLATTIVNRHVEYVVKRLNAQLERFEDGLGGGMWNTGVYLLTTNDNIAKSAMMQLKSIVSGKNSHLEPIRIHEVTGLFNKDNGQNCFRKALARCAMPITPIAIIDTDNVSHPIVNPFEGGESQLSTLLTTAELSYLVNFPLHSVPGISVTDTVAEFSLSTQHIDNSRVPIEIGNLTYNGLNSNIKVNLPLNTLSRHALVCGVNGSGKTNTVLGILDGFLKANRPFFVIEPAKTEYVDWAIQYNKTVDDPKKRIKIFIPGCKTYAKSKFTPDILRINPFEVIRQGDGEMRTLSHIDRLKSSFAAAFPMQDILPVIMEHLLYTLYQKQKILDENAVNLSHVEFPTIGMVNRAFVDDLMGNIGYARENTQNIAAALRTRFKSLTLGWKGELLNNQKLSDSGISWKELFETPVVVNLSYAGDDKDRAFIMSLLLQFLYEYRISESESGDFSFNSNQCRHLVVVEEAHRVMGRCDNQESPQYKSGLMFSNFLSEVRAYGQGMMVVDQVPSRLIDDAVKNTNVKIIHKLVAADDARTMADCIGLTSEQQRIIPKLNIGQAVLAGFNSADLSAENSSDIYLAQVNKKK